MPVPGVGGLDAFVLGGEMLQSGTGATKDKKYTGSLVLCTLVRDPRSGGPYYLNVGRVLSPTFDLVELPAPSLSAVYTG